jgi:hypothetical protein
VLNALPAAIAERHYLLRSAEEESIGNFGAPGESDHIAGEKISPEICDYCNSEQSGDPRDQCVSKYATLRKTAIHVHDVGSIEDEYPDQAEEYL